MPTTQYNITQILRHVPNYSRSEILDVLNEVQTLVYSTDSEQTIKIDSTTGLPPYLATTEGQYQYNCPADCRRTAVIFTESWPYPYSRTIPSIPWKEYYFRHRQWYETTVHSRDAIPDNNQVATVTFYIDPGDSTDKYYHYYYILPTELTDESIELTLPPHVHWRMRRMVIALLSSEQYGQRGFDEAVIEKQIKRCRSELNAGAKTTMRSTPWPSEYQEFAGDWQGYRR